MALYSLLFDGDHNAHPQRFAIRQAQVEGDGRPGQPVRSKVMNREYGGRHVSTGRVSRPTAATTTTGARREPSGRAPGAAHLQLAAAGHRSPVYIRRRREEYGMKDSVADGDDANLEYNKRHWPSKRARADERQGVCVVCSARILIVNS